jgi:hypothetical protein
VRQMGLPQFVEDYEKGTCFLEVLSRLAGELFEDILPSVSSWSCLFINGD